MSILVFIEHKGGALNKTSLEAIAAAAKAGVEFRIRGGLRIGRRSRILRRRIGGRIRRRGICWRGIWWRRIRFWRWLGWRRRVDGRRSHGLLLRRRRRWQRLRCDVASAGRQTRPWFTFGEAEPRGWKAAEKAEKQDLRASSGGS